MASCPLTIMRSRSYIPRLASSYGLFSALMTIVAFLVFYFIGQQPWRNLISLILDVIIIGAFCFIAIRDFRDRHNDGILHFYHGMSIAFFVYLVTATLFSLFYLLFIAVITPDFMEIYQESMIEFLESRKELLIQQGGEEEFQRQIDSVGQVQASGLVLDAFGKKVISGLVLAPIFSIVFRTIQR